MTRRSIAIFVATLIAAAALLTQTGCEGSGPRDTITAAVAQGEQVVQDLRQDLADAQAVADEADDIAAALPPGSDAATFAQEVADQAAAVLAKIEAELVEAEATLTELQTRLTEINASAAENGDTAANLQAVGATIESAGQSIGGEIGTYVGVAGAGIAAIAAFFARRTKRERDQIADFNDMLHERSDREQKDVERLRRTLEQLTKATQAKPQDVEPELDTEAAAVFRAIRNGAPLPKTLA